MLEHSDFDVVKSYLQRYHPDAGKKGRCYADVSACATPFRQSSFPEIRDLPPSALLFGSDFPTPVFELSADLKENLRDRSGKPVFSKLDRTLLQKVAAVSGGKPNVM